MPTQLADINTPDWGLSIDNYGEVYTDVDDVNQCILLILNTSKGSRPMNPDYGTEIWRVIDKPAPVAIPQVKLEILKNVPKWEPRCEIKTITHELGNDSGNIIFTIEWTYTVTGQTRATTFNLILQN